MELFEIDYGEDNSPKDETQITNTLLYFSEEELKEFKQLCKIGMKKEWPDNYKEKANISDLLLIALRKLYKNEENNIKKSS